MMSQVNLGNGTSRVLPAALGRGGARPPTRLSATSLSMTKSRIVSRASKPSEYRSLTVRATTGDIGGGGGGAGKGGAGGGGGRRWDGDEGEQPKKRVLWQGWADRVAADPQFVYKVIIEQIIGVGAAVAGDMASRPNWGLNELDFVFATLVVGSIVNFSLMYLLAPTGPAGSAAAGGLIARIFSDQILTSWGAPGGHMFQPGFTLGPRLVNFLYKGAIFAGIGMAAGLAGTAISNGLLALRCKLDPNHVSQNEPPNVVANAGCWALHMGLSSNLRYQILNGFDMVVQPVIPSGAFRILTSVIRGGNNILGGMSFVFLAKLFGVQKAAEEPQKTLA